MIQPTVGRIVWFWPSPDLCPGPWPGIQPLGAMIAHVHHGRLVNLTVSEVSGRTIGYENVTLMQEGDERPTDERGFATWMPYQLGQAKQNPVLQEDAGGTTLAPVSDGQPSLGTQTGATDEGQQAGQGQAVEQGQQGQQG